jgi:PncC family amidohydrolase
MLTDIPGSSDVFYGGVVVYDNLLKEKLLGVRPETLRDYGAVSSETAVEMAAGLLKIADADYLVSVTGVAGPGGGSVEKPAGTVFIGFGKKAEDRKISIRSGRFFFEGDRETVRQKTAMKVFETLQLDLTTGEPGDKFNTK